MEPRGSGMRPEKVRRTDRGWIRAGMAVLVAGVLGGGVLVAAGGGTGKPRQVTADGVAGASPAGAVEAEALRPPEPAKDDPVVGEKIEMGSDGGSVTVVAVEDNVSAGRLFGAGDRQKYIAAEVKGCSGPKEKNITFEPAYFLLRLDDGTIRDTGVGAKKPSLEGGTIPAGKCLSGWVTFTVPDGALPTAVIYDGSSRTTWTMPLPKDAKQTTTTTMRAGATTSTTGDPDDSDVGDSETTTTTRARASTTSTTRAKSTVTTARSTATTGTSGSTTTTKPAATTATTGKSGSTTTSTTSGTKTTGTTAPAKASTTTTTGANVESDPADPEG
jgi:hypothetical protein